MKGTDFKICDQPGWLNERCCVSDRWSTGISNAFGKCEQAQSLNERAGSRNVIDPFRLTRGGSAAYVTNRSCMELPNEGAHTRNVMRQDGQIRCLRKPVLRNLTNPGRHMIGCS